MGGGDGVGLHFEIPTRQRSGGCCRVANMGIRRWDPAAVRINTSNSDGWGVGQADPGVLSAARTRSSAARCAGARDGRRTGKKGKQVGAAGGRAEERAHMGGGCSGKAGRAGGCQDGVLCVLAGRWPMGRAGEIRTGWNQSKASRYEPCPWPSLPVGASGGGVGRTLTAWRWPHKARSGYSPSPSPRPRARSTAPRPGFSSAFMF